MNSEEINLNSCTVRGYDAYEIKIDDKKIPFPCVISNTVAYTGLLPDQYSKLSQEHINELVRFKSEFILLGTGKKQIFLNDKLNLHDVAFEVMDTGSACRILSTLFEESRAVLAVLFAE